MAPPTINRIHLFDDTGAGEDGTILDDALFQTLQDNIDGLSSAIIGAAGTNLNASNLSSGTVPIARLGLGVTKTIISTDTGTLNDWAPGLSGNTVIIWVGTAPTLITGIAGGVPGAELTIINESTFPLVFQWIAPASAVGNRMLTYSQISNCVIGPAAAVSNSIARFIYDGRATRWAMTDLFSGDPMAFTPTLQFGGASVGVAGALTGEYIQIKNHVFFMCRCTLTSKGTSTGAAAFGGLPMVPRGGGLGYARAQATYYAGTVGVTGGVFAYTTPGAATLNLWTPNASNILGLTDANFTNGTDLIMAGDYPTS
jgi:hypothetical protein